MIKMYNGMVFDMKTGEVLEHGDVSYIDESEITQLKGGGSTQTTTNSTRTDPRLEQAAVDLLGTAKNRFNSGALGRVADASGLQNQAFGSAGGLYNQATKDATAIRDSASAITPQGLAAAGLNQNANAAGATGNLGGARHGLADRATNDQAALQSAQAQAGLLGQANSLQGGALSQLGQVGSAQRGVEQEYLDRDVKALKNYGNAFGSAQGGFGQESTSTSPKQGGK